MAATSPPATTASRIKSGRGMEGYTLLQTTEDVTITNCTMADSIFACIGIGSETSGGIRNVRIEHCKFTRAQTFAIYIKSRPGRGAFIEDIVADDLDVSGTDGGFLRFNILGSGIQDEIPGARRRRHSRPSGIIVLECSRDRLPGAGGWHRHPSEQAARWVCADQRHRHLRQRDRAGQREERRDSRRQGNRFSRASAQYAQCYGKGLKGAVEIDGPKVPASDRRSRRA